MSFVLKLRDILVGRSDLADQDRDSRTAHGVFRPGLGWNLVEPIFALSEGADAPVSDDQLARYRRARDTLALVLYGPDGALIETIRIEVRRDAASNTGLVLDAAIVDDAFWLR